MSENGFGRRTAKKYAVKTVLIGPNSLRAATTMAWREKFKAAREARLRDKQGSVAPEGTGLADPPQAGAN